MKEENHQQASLRTGSNKEGVVIDSSSSSTEIIEREPVQNQQQQQALAIFLLDTAAFQRLLFLITVVTTMTRIITSLAIFGILSLWRSALGFVPFAAAPQSHRTLLLEAEAKNSNEKKKPYQTDIPLVFIHGMKGSHLASLEGGGEKKMKKRAWLSLRGLLNFPPKPDDHPDRDLSLPLSYGVGESGTIQDRGDLVVDGLVDHIIELGGKSVELLPFYGHASKHLQELDELQRIRPTKCYVYDWRRSLPEISDDFYKFVQREFPDPNTKIQILAHSMGGMIAFDQMRKHPNKFTPGAVLVGVPFETGIQYFQDLHRGYYTELGRNRQFTPPSQFTLSSHWTFFPVNEQEASDTFVDVTDNQDGSSIDFKPDESAIGKPGTIFQPTVSGKKIPFDFYNVDEWEKNQVGIFDPFYKKGIDDKTMKMYKNHMDIQLKIGKEWRANSLCPSRTTEEGTTMPELVVCQTNTIPTLNQILRRRKQQQQDSSNSNNANDNNECCQWEYDYTSGRSVPGDGRIDFAKSFPPKGFNYKEIALESMHAKQMCWEENGGSLGRIMEEVTNQLEKHLEASSSSAIKEEATAAKEEEMMVVNQ